MFASISTNITTCKKTLLCGGVFFLLSTCDIMHLMSFQCRDQISISKFVKQNTCGYTDQQYKDFLRRSLMIVNPCFDDADAQARIDALYQMFRVQSRCDPELLYLITRREMLKNAMFCESFKVDQVDRVGESNSVSEFESLGQSRSEAQQSGHTSQFADLIGSQRYNDFADTTLRGETQRTAFSLSHDESHTRATDFGSGASVSDTDGVRMSESIRTLHEESSMSERSESDGAARGCNYQISQSATDGSGLNILIFGLGRQASKTAWDHEMRNDTVSRAEGTRNSSSARQLNAASSSSSQSLRVSSSYFNALVDEVSWGIHQSMAEDHSRGQSDSVSHAEGLGQSNTEARNKAQGSTQGTSESTSEFDSQRRGTRSSFAISDDLKLGQRFEHLKVLYENTLKMIQLKRSRLVASGYGIGKLILCREDGFIPYDFADVTEQKFCCPIPEAANLYSHLSTSYGRRSDSVHW